MRLFSLIGFNFPLTQVSRVAWCGFCVFCKIYVKLLNFFNLQPLLLCREMLKVINYNKNENKFSTPRAQTGFAK